MPSLQFGPPEPKKEDYLGATIAAFINKGNERDQQNNESDALADIYKRYQGDGENILKRQQAIQTDKRISPTTKVNLINQNLEFQKYNQELQKTTQKQMKDEEEKRIKRKQVEGLEKKYGLEAGALEDYYDNPSLANQVAKPTKQNQADRPISEQQRNAIKAVEDDPKFKDATLPEKSRMLRDGLVSKENEDAVLKPYNDQAKLDNEKKETTRAEELKFNDHYAKFDEELNNGEKQARIQLSAIKDVRKAVQGGKVDPSNLVNVFRSLGETGKKLSNAFLTKDHATILASIPAFLEGRKELFGVRLSDADLALLEDKLPNIDKSIEANLEILNLMEKYSRLGLLRSKIGREIKKENKGLRPLGYNDKVNERFNEMTRPVTIITPNGYETDIPAYQVGAAIKKGASLKVNDEQ